jgi:pSer/pThr/pTyr-binding forkhead associated (FHA) protein
VITCPKCFKENQDHYKFCLGCGAELPRDATPKKFAAGTPPHGVPAVVPAGQAGRSTNVPPDDSTLQGGAGARARAAGSTAPTAPVGSPVAPAASPPVTPPPPGPSSARPPIGTPVPVAPDKPAAGGTAPLAPIGGSGMMTCPQCEHLNPTNNKFCASCGFKLARVSALEAAPAPAVAASGAATSGVVLTALRADGSEAGTYALPSGNTTIGRDTGAIFAGDSYLSPRHATFSPRGGKLFVHDDSSLNGVYKKLRRDEPVLLQLGEIFRIGQEILRYEPLSTMPTTSDGVERLGSPSKDYIGRIALVIGRDVTGNAYPVPNTGIHLGRERGDVLFPEDGYVSGLHCRLAPQGGNLLLTDLGSSNGTFIRVQGEAEVINGDILLMGQQLFRITM